MRHRLPPLPRLSQGRFDSNRSPRPSRRPASRKARVVRCGTRGALGTSQPSSESSVALSSDRSPVRMESRRRRSSSSRLAVGRWLGSQYQKLASDGVTQVKVLSGARPPRSRKTFRRPTMRPGNSASPSLCRPEIRRDYPLNLSISLSGGKETNKDSPSNGE